MFLLIPFLISALFLEGTITTLPLVLVCLLLWTIMKRDASVFLLAFFAGLILDIFSVRTLGSTSLFFLVVVFLIFLYQKKYEIQSYQFVFVASFLGSLGFFLMFGGENIILQSLINSFLAGTLFFFLKM